MKKYVIEEKPLQAVLDYLATRPYKEVVLLITNIQNVTKPLDESKIYSQVDLEAAKNEAYTNGLGVGFEQGSQEVKTLEKFSDD